MKRFYATAAVIPLEQGCTVALDGKPILTPGRAALVLPTDALGEAIAGEWVAQGATLNPATMPLTGLAYAAIDRVMPNVGAFAASLARYAETDLLCYRVTSPADLVARQAAGWDPILNWAQTRYDIRLSTTAGIIHAAQAPATLARLADAFAALDPFRLAALHPVVTITGSAVIGLAVAEHRLDAELAYAMGQLDELWQAEHWGLDPLAAAAAKERRTALTAAARLLDLL